jgi:polysaccharide biosynthesis PFTS motif protein
MNTSNWKQKFQRISVAFPFEKYKIPLSPNQYERFIERDGIMVGRRLLDQIFLASKPDSKSNGQSVFSNDNLNLRFNQNILTHLFDEKYFTSPLCISILSETAILYPIPPKFFSIFLSEKIRVNRLGCSLLWILFLFLKFFRQILRLMTFTFKIGFSTKSKNIIDLRDQTLVFGATMAALSSGSELLNFREWCEENLAEPKSNSLVYVLSDSEIDLASKESIISESDFFNSNFVNEFRAYFYLAILFVGAFLNLDFHRIFLISANIEEVITTFRMRFLDSALSPNAYFFISPIGVNKPLWVCQEENEGKYIGFIFLATYSEPPFKNGEPAKGSYWQLNAWRNVYLKDNLMLDYLNLKDTGNDLSVTYVNCPDWVDANYLLSAGKKNVLTVFDGEPQVGYYGLGTINEYKWNRIETSIAFLTEIIKIGANLDVLIYVKPKRKQIEKRFNLYSQLLDQIQSGAYKNVILVPEEVSARRICRASTIVLSKPFSTAAVIAIEEGCKSFYFDPIKNSFSGMSQARGVNIVSRADELIQIVSDVIAGK